MSQSRSGRRESDGRGSLTEPAKLATKATSPSSMPRFDGEGIRLLSVSLIPLDASPGKSGCMKRVSERPQDAAAEKRTSDTVTPGESLLKAAGNRMSGRQIHSSSRSLTIESDVLRERDVVENGPESGDTAYASQRAATAQESTFTHRSLLVVMVHVKDGLRRRYAAKATKPSSFVICRMPVVWRSGTEVPPGEQIGGRRMLAI